MQKASTIKTIFHFVLCWIFSTSFLQALPSSVFTFDSLQYLKNKNLEYFDSVIQQEEGLLIHYTEDELIELLFLRTAQDIIMNRLPGKHFELLDSTAYTQPYILLKAFYTVKNERELDALLFNQVKEIANARVHSEFKSRALYYLGKNERIKGALNEAYHYFQRAYETDLRTVNKAIVEWCLIELSLIYRIQEEYEKAFNLLQKALQLAEEHEKKYEEAFINNQLGEIQLYLENFRLAQNYFEASFYSAKQQKGTFLAAQAQSNLGAVLIEQRKFKKAIDELQRALVVFYKKDDYLGISLTQKRLGNAFYAFKNYNLSRASYLLGLEYATRQDDEAAVASFYYYLSELELADNNISKALSYAQKSEQIYAKLNADLLRHISVYQLLANIYGAQKNYAAAYTYLNKFMLVNDSIQTQQMKEKITELSALFQTEQKERLILSQKKEIQERTNTQLLKEQELENRELLNRQMFFFIIVLVLFFGIILTLILFKNKQNRLQLDNKTLELQHTIFRSQMNPHFIFNSMSVIQGYIYENDVKNSSNFLVNFSKLMRLILENSAREFIPLEVELEILERYLSVQKLRFEDRFDYEIINVSGIDISVLSIPPMLMQPFIENAIEHGQLHLKENGKIILSFELENNLLNFLIRDNGIGKNESLKTKKNDHKSMAIDITKERISLLNEKYKTAGSLKVIDLAEVNQSGTLVQISTVCKKRV